VANAPDRLIGLGLVPLQHPSRIVECLDDAVLGRGLGGVEISSFAGDVELSDERLEPFWARAEELGCVVFLHPFGCSLDERLDRFYLSNTVGQPTENAVALSHLIFSGVLDRYPGLKIVAAHGGGYLPTVIGRSDRAWRVRPEAHGCEHAPSSYLSRIWFDTVVHDVRTLRALVEVAGASQVMLGSDFPFDMGLDDPVAEVRGAGFGEDVLRGILGENADSLLASRVTA
jgi:aminocarboxymuconate-semialdehyde decarboxylase